jgi:small-conductance mechanosensitive channel
MIERIQQEFGEWWDGMLEISPSIFFGTALLILFIILGNFAKKVFIKRFGSRTDDLLLTNFLGKILFWIFVIIGISFFLKKIGLGGAVSGLLAGAGVTAIVLGFAFKDIGENLLAGIMLAFNRPFNIGNVIEIDSFVGTVKALQLRSTHIRTFNGRDIYIPNSSLIKNPLINYTQDGLLRHDFVVGLDYGESIQDVMHVINSTLENVKEIVHAEGLAPFVTISEFATSTINLKIHFWINTKDFLGSTTVLKSEVMRQIISALIAKDFGMPADILELKIYQEGRPIPIQIKNEVEKK